MKFIFTAILFFLISCSSSKLEKVEWEGELVKNAKDPEFLYWKNGNQFQRHKKDSIEINFSGFRYEDAIYIVVLVDNKAKKPLNLMTNKSFLSYRFNSQDYQVKASTTRNLDNNHFSFINTLIAGTGKITSLFLNLPIDIFLPSNTNDKNINKDISDGDISHKVIFSNHTLFENSSYGGFMIFEIDDEHSEQKFDFDLHLELGITVNAKGKF